MVKTLFRKGGTAQGVYKKKGNGYFYFSYDNGDIYDTYSVFTCQLNTLTIEQWKEEAAFFINALESQ
jgi:hypothetical protein